MPELIAQGAAPDQRWRRVVTPGHTFTVGRQAAAWSTPWDGKISRRHVQACWNHGRLEVRRLAAAGNPIFFRGRPTDHFQLKPGEHFVIGETTFSLTDARVEVSHRDPEPVTEVGLKAEELQRIRYRDPDQRIDVLSRLPRVIAGAVGDDELCMRLVNLLLSGIPRAAVAAVTMVRRGQDTADDVLVRHWDRRKLTDQPFTPSLSLIRQAVAHNEGRIHVWQGVGSGTFTQAEGVDWALCCPIPGEENRGWALYVAGSFPDDGSGSSDTHHLEEDLKFAEVAASTMSQLRELRSLERQQASLSQFLSPVVLDALFAGDDPEQVLAPRETDVSVLFCDLRGFSRRSEQDADDLLGLLERVSDALGVMTHHILQEGGVVGDFHGDAAMGFWGWPLAQPDAAVRACRAALGIRTAFAAAAGHAGHPLADFQMGIGIASGSAVAGKIGTVDQVKVTVFGPVVNLAARLETMTKQLRAPILIDEATAAELDSALSSDPALGRLRRIARIRPFGMQAALMVSELLPAAADFPQLDDEHLAAYEAALDALLAGDWATAFETLHRVPADDRVKDFLTVFIAQHNRVAPENWDGVIEMTSK